MAGMREKSHVGSFPARPKGLHDANYLSVSVFFSFFVSHMMTEQLHLDILTLQKENLKLEQEKLHLQVSLLKQHLLKIQREN